MTEFFEGVESIRYAGPESDDPLTFRWYDADRIVLGRSMRDQLRFANSLLAQAVEWFDIFGDGTLDRPWVAGLDPMEAAEQKMAAALEFMSKLTVPFWCFHDWDIAPEGDTFAESARNLDHMAELAGGTRTGRVSGCCGARQALRQPAVHGRTGDQPRSRGVRLRRRSGCALHERHPPARREQLRAVGRSRRTRDAAQHCT